MKFYQEIPLLNLLLQAAEEKVGKGKVLVNPYGSLSYTNPLGYDKFPLHRVSDLEVNIFHNSYENDPNEKLDTEVAESIAERFIEKLEERSYKVEDTPLGIKIISPDKSERHINYGFGNVMHFDWLKKIPLPESLSTSDFYGSKEALQYLRKVLDGQIEKEKVLDSLSDHYSWLYFDANRLVNQGNPKFLKRVAEMSKYRGERPEIREAILRKYDAWKEFVNIGWKKGKFLDKLLGDWRAISIDYDYSDGPKNIKPKNVIDQNLIKDENGMYRLKVLM